MPDSQTGPSRDRDQLRQLIARLSEGVIIIDMDRTILWTNEAALRLHGVTRQDDLGASVDKYLRRFRATFRNNHPVEPGEHPVERALAGEPPKDVVLTISPVAEPETNWVHAVHCAVIRDADSRPDCLVLMIEDQTDRYEAEERFERAFNANPAPALICRMTDLTFIRVNPGFLAMTGCPAQDVVDHSLSELDILGEVEDRAAVLGELKRGGHMAQREATLALPDGARKGVIVAGQPIEVSNEPCVLFTFVDLEPRLRVEAALRQGEERFSKAFRLSPAPSLICAADTFALVEVNEAFLRLTGFVEAELIGRAPGDLAIWKDPATRKRLLAELAQSGRLPERELQVRVRDGAVLDCVLAGEVIELNDARCVLCVLRDITERKRSEAELVAAIDAVLADTAWLSRGIVERLATLKTSAASSARAGSGFAALTARERDVLGLICEGATDAEMAERLRLSRHTIRNHLSSLYRKIGVTHRGAAAVCARARGATDLASARAHGRRKG